MVWLDGHPQDDEMTLGHVDALARFVDCGAAVVGRIREPSHPDHGYYEAAAGRLAGAGLTVTRMDLPVVGGGAAGHLNWYVANGVVVVGTFGVPREDDWALGFVRELFPGRTATGVDARRLWRHGGGVHCVTMQEPG